MKIRLETKISIANLIIKDYQEQLTELKLKKKDMQYEDYRFKYVRLHNNIQSQKRTLNRLKELKGEWYA